jgi:uncharacterized protein
MDTQTAVEHLQIVPIAGILACLSCWIAYKTGFFQCTIIRSGERQLSFWTLLKAFAILFGVQLLMMPLIIVLLMSYESGHWVTMAEIDRGTAWQSWASISGSWVATVWIATYLRSLGQELHQKIWSRGEWKGYLDQVKHFLFGLMTWIICFPLIVAIEQALSFILYFWLKTQPKEQEAVKVVKEVMDNPLLFGAMAVTIVFIIPVIEELLFRGFLQTWLQERMKTANAIMISALIFALFHYSTDQGYSNIEFIIPLFILSCFLGFIYERQKSLWAPIGLHAAFNLFSLFLLASES